MVSINGYFDGKDFIPLDNALPRKNQKVIITILDEFFYPGNEKPFRKYVGTLQVKDAEDIVNALSDCKQADIDEW